VSRIAAIILAAGLSTRMGRPKPMLLWRGRTLLARAADVAIDGGFDPVLAVINDSPEPAAELARHSLRPGSGQAPRIHIVVNPDAHRGIGTSIRRGIAQLLSIDPHIAAAAILLADQPLITAPILRELTAAYRAAGKPVAAADMGGPIGPPLVISASLFHELLALPDDRGAASIWKQHPDWVAHFPCPAAAADVDTPGDFDKLPDDE
jgi:molybdenum cofactor cytidylyltransferase